MTILSDRFHTQQDPADIFRANLLMLINNNTESAREEVYRAIEKIWDYNLYKKDLSADDLIQSIKLYLGK